MVFSLHHLTRNPAVNDSQPRRGDAVWITFDPQAGHEQARRRPAVILSPTAYNGQVGLAILCPITNQIKGYPFEVQIPTGLAISGVILADQVKSLDWQVCEVGIISTPSASVTAHFIRMLNQSTSCWP